MRPLRLSEMLGALGVTPNLHLTWIKVRSVPNDLLSTLCLRSCANGSINLDFRFAQRPISKMTSASFVFLRAGSGSFSFVVRELGSLSSLLGCPTVLPLLTSARSTCVTPDMNTCLPPVLTKECCESSWMGPALPMRMPIAGLKQVVTNACCVGRLIPVGTGFGNVQPPLTSVVPFLMDLWTWSVQHPGLFPFMVGPCNPLLLSSGCATSMDSPVNPRYRWHRPLGRSLICSRTAAVFSRLTRIAELQPTPLSMLLLLLWTTPNLVSDRLWLNLCLACCSLLSERSSKPLWLRSRSRWSLEFGFEFGVTARQSFRCTKNMCLIERRSISIANTLTCCKNLSGSQLISATIKLPSSKFPRMRTKPNMKLNSNTGSSMAMRRRTTRHVGLIKPALRPPGRCGMPMCNPCMKTGRLGRWCVGTWSTLADCGKTPLAVHHPETLIRWFLEPPVQPEFSLPFVGFQMTQLPCVSPALNAFSILRWLLMYSDGFRASEHPKPRCSGFPSFTCSLASSVGVGQLPSQRRMDNGKFREERLPGWRIMQSSRWGRNGSDSCCNSTFVIAGLSLLRLLLGPIPVGSVASKVPLGFNFVLKSFILLRGFFANNLVRQLRAQASRWRVWGGSCVGCKGCRRCFPSAAAEHPEQKNILYFPQ